MLKKTLIAATFGALVFSLPVLPQNNFLPASIVFASKETADDLYKKALELDRKSDYAGAIKFYKKVLEIDPNHEDALWHLKYTYIALGREYEDQERYQEMADAYIDYLKLCTDDASDADDVSDGYNQLGKAYNYLQKYDKAVDCFNKSLKSLEVYWTWFKKEYGYYHYSLYAQDKAWNFKCLGDSYMGLGDYQKAIDYFGQYLNLNKNHEFSSLYGYAHGIATANIGVCYANLHDYYKFVEVPKKIDGYNIEDEFTYRWVIFGKAVLKDFDNANESLGISMEFNPKDADTFCLYSFIYAMQDNYQEATAFFDKAMTLKPNNEAYKEAYRSVLNGLK